MSVSGVGACSKRGGLGGGWRWFCTHNCSAFDCSAKAKHCARENIDPPRTHGSAWQSAKKSTLCVRRGKSELRAAEWGGWGFQKTSRCKDREGLGSCQWSGVRLGLDEVAFFTCLLVGSGKQLMCEQAEARGLDASRLCPGHSAPT